MFLLSFMIIYHVCLVVYSMPPVHESSDHLAVIDSFTIESSINDDHDHQPSPDQSLFTSSNLSEFAKRSLNLPIYSLIVFSVIGIFLVCGCGILVCFLCMFIIGGIIELRRIRVVGLRRPPGGEEILNQSYYEDEIYRRLGTSGYAPIPPTYSEAVTGSSTLVHQAHSSQSGSRDVLPDYKDVCLDNTETS